MFKNKPRDEAVGDTAHDDDGPAENPRTDEDRASVGQSHERREHAAATPRDEYAYRREEFGGIKFGAVFYGWLVAVALTLLLIAIVSAVATAVGSSLDVTQSEAELQAGSIGIASAVALLVTLALGYLAGGYVAGRLARFDGVRQGIGVWLLGLIITIIVVVVGAIFGTEYNVFDRVNLPSLPVRTDAATLGGIITGLAILIGTLILAGVGGMLGQRYHRKIDRTRV